MLPKSLFTHHAVVKASLYSVDKTADLLSFALNVGISNICLSGGDGLVGSYHDIMTGFFKFAKSFQILVR